MGFTKDTPVGEIASVHPLSTRVFHRHGIDFCCGGQVALSDACAQRSLDSTAVLDEIRQEIAAVDGKDLSWVGAPAKDLIDHILSTFHQPLKKELPRLQEMAVKVLGVHGPKDPETLKELSDVVTWLATELQQHLLKEEEVLFPLILSGEGAHADGPIAVMEDEHVQAGHALRRIRELTKDFVVPEEACNTWSALWHGLEALETDLHDHIHLENNILFPAALKG